MNIKNITTIALTLAMIGAVSNAALIPDGGAMQAQFDPTTGLLQLANVSGAPIDFVGYEIIAKEGLLFSMDIPGTRNDPGYWLIGDDPVYAASVLGNPDHTTGRGSPDPNGNMAGWGNLNPGGAYLDDRIGEATLAGYARLQPDGHPTRPNVYSLGLALNTATGPVVPVVDSLNNLPGPGTLFISYTPRGSADTMQVVNFLNLAGGLDPVVDARAGEPNDYAFGPNGDTLVGGLFAFTLHGEYVPNDGPPLADVKWFISGNDLATEMLMAEGDLNPAITYNHLSALGALVRDPGSPYSIRLEVAGISDPGTLALPEPTTMGLMLFGAIGMVARKKRRS